MKCLKYLTIIILTASIVSSKADNADKSSSLANVVNYKIMVGEKNIVLSLQSDEKQKKTIIKNLIYRELLDQIITKLEIKVPEETIKAAVEEYFMEAGLIDQISVDNALMQNDEVAKVTLEEMKKKSEKSMKRDLEVWKLYHLVGKQNLNKENNPHLTTEEINKRENNLKQEFINFWKEQIKNIKISVSPDIGELDISAPPDMPYLPSNILKMLFQNDAK